MKVYVRADSSKYMGSGHVMRCLTLADGLKENGAQVEFICRDLPGNLSDLISERGYKVRFLAFGAENYQQENYTDEYAFWLAVPWKQDVQETLSAIKGTCNLLIVDHYGLDYRWQSQLRVKAEKIMVIDDLANRQHDCDYLLDHNFYVDAEERYDQLVPRNCVQLVGPQYALIRPEIVEARKWREQHYSFPNKERFNCLVFMGGSDTPNCTQKIVDTLLSHDNIRNIKVVVGENNPNIQALQTRYKCLAKVDLLVHPPHYYKLLAMSDFVIGAGGVSVLERLCIRVPQYVFQVADNQKEICENIEHSKSGVFIGDIHVYSSFIKLQSSKLWNLTHLLTLSNAGESIIDGDGIKRVVDYVS